MATAFVGVGTILQDFGLSSAAIQSRELTRNQRDALAWLNIVLGTVLTVGFYFSAPLVARAFDNSALVPIVQWLSLVVLVSGASTQFRASLTREMHFGQLAVCDLIAPAVGLAAGVIGALVDFGPYALVIQQLTTAAVGLVCVAVACRWLPRIPSRHTKIRPFLTYGGNLFLSQLFDYASKNIDTVIIGARFSAAEVGVYDRAFKLLMVPVMQLNAPFTRVALPTLSRLQDDPDRFKNYLLRAQKLVSYFMVLVIAYCASQAVPLVDIFLGPQWDKSAPILQILAVGGVFHIVWYGTMWVFLAKALTRGYLVFTVIARAASIGLIFAGSTWGVIGVAIGYSAGFALQWPLAVWWIRSVPGVSPRAMLVNGGKIIGVTLVATVPGLVVSTWWRPFSNLSNMIVGTACLLGLLALIVAAIPSVRADLQELLGALRSAIHRRPSPPGGNASGSE